MNHSHDIVLYKESESKSHQSIAAAKTNLLAWAEDCDDRSRTSSRSLATVATTGMFAVIGGMVIARIIVTSPRKTGSMGGLVKKAVATLIFRAVMARVQNQILMRTSAQ